MKLLMISTDRNIFDKNSAVAARQIEYAQKYEEVHLIVFSGKNFTETTLGTNIWVYPTRSASRWMYVFDALRLGRFIVEKRGITHITCQDPFETGLVGALIRNRHAVELELQVHTDIGSPYFQNFTFLNRIRTLLSKYTLPRATSIRVVSDRIKKYISRYVEESKITVRPIFVDIEKIKNSPITVDLHAKYPQFSKIILMVSRLEPEKNIEMALEAFKKVIETIPQAGFVIVGSGSGEKRLKDLVRQLGIENSVMFEGQQSDVVSYYKTCDCYLLTSWYEGYGMTLMEAGAAGARILSTDVGVAKEVGADIMRHTTEDFYNGIIRTIS